MHRARFYGLFIDSPLDTAEASIDFWSQAFGVEPEREADDEDYTRLLDAVPGIEVEVQAVDDAPRYHIDIETDDIEAEAQRLIGLGAEVIRKPGWYVLRAPGGHILCVVAVQSDPEFFAKHAKVYP
jgi:predicted enzyme related to lactoylglutathione lyase